MVHIFLFLLLLGNACARWRGIGELEAQLVADLPDVLGRDAEFEEEGKFDYCMYVFKERYGNDAWELFKTYSNQQRVIDKEGLLKMATELAGGLSWAEKTMAKAAAPKTMTFEAFYDQLKKNHKDTHRRTDPSLLRKQPSAEEESAMDSVVEGAMLQAEKEVTEFFTAESEEYYDAMDSDELDEQALKKFQDELDKQALKIFQNHGFDPRNVESLIREKEDNLRALDQLDQMQFDKAQKAALAFEQENYLRLFEQEYESCKRRCSQVFNKYYKRKKYQNCVSHNCKRVYVQNMQDRGIDPTPVLKKRESVKTRVCNFLGSMRRTHSSAKKAHR